MSFTMGLYVMPKYKNCSPVEVYTVEGYFDYLRNTKKKITFNEWYKNESGFDNYSEEELTSIFTNEMLEFYKQHYRALYWPTDTNKKFPRYRIAEDMTFIEWDSDNAYGICEWLIAHTDKVNDCHMVSKEVLEELLAGCKRDLAELENLVLPLNEDGTYNDDYLGGMKAALHLIPRILSTVDFEKNMIHFDFD